MYKEKDEKKFLNAFLIQAVRERRRESEREREFESQALRNAEYYCAKMIMQNNLKPYPC